MSRSVLVIQWITQHVSGTCFCNLYCTFAETEERKNCGLWVIMCNLASESSRLGN